MQLEKCVLDIDLAVVAPMVRTTPEEEWVKARNSKAIPGSLFKLYEDARYLSFGGGTRFLGDSENVLFSYFGMVLRSLMESLVEADQHLPSFVESQARTYDAGKKIRGESWDPDAHSAALRHFRGLLFSLHSALDSLSDLIALLLTGLIPRLTVGRAQFMRVEKWLEHTLPAEALIISPFELHARKLHTALKPLVYPDRPERDWLPLMRMLRNKAAHLGQPVFRQVGLHDESLKYYVFAPRQWPYLYEKYMSSRRAEIKPDRGFLPKLFRETLMHQDMPTYAKGLKTKIHDVVRVSISILAEAYDAFKEFSPNVAALAELQGNSERYEFEYFRSSANNSSEQPASSEPAPTPRP